jgi:ribosomal protein S27AE
MAKEYSRTCTRCGTSWYVPKELAKGKKPKKMAIAGAKMRSSGAKMSSLGVFGSGAAREAAALEAKRDRLTDAARCPNCGSVSFKQAKA